MDPWMTYEEFLALALQREEDALQLARQRELELEALAASAPCQDPDSGF